MWSGSRRLVLALLVVTGLGLVACSRTESVVPGQAGPAAQLVPEVVALDAPEIANPLRGQYQWIGERADPPEWPTPDVYYRDEIRWGGKVEAARGVYDFAGFDKGLAEAERGKGLFSFRVMAFCPGCGENLAPSYVARQPDGQPDWNSETFLSGYADLMKALGARYDSDPRLGFVDVGGYGSYGEYHLSSDGRGPVGVPITPENSKRLVKSVLDAFPSKFVMMMTPDAGYLRDALALSDRVGIRVDCVGNVGFKGSRIDQVPEALERWKTAPWIGEWCGDSDVADEFALGLEQVRQYHISALSSANFPGSYAKLPGPQQANFRLANKSAGYRFVLNTLTVPRTVPPGSTMAVSASWSNIGVGPAYLPWDTMIELRDPRSGAVAFAGKSAVDLRTFLPTGDRPVTVDDRFTVPDTLPVGTYDVYVHVVSPGGYLPPLGLAVAGRTADGAYKLGSIDVAQ